MSFFVGYVGLGTGTASFVEQTGNDYARVAITLQQVITGSNRHVNAAASSTFTAGTAWSSASTQVGIFSALTGGNPLLWWTKTTAIPALGASASYVFPAGDHNLYLTDLASQAGAISNWQSGDTFGTTAGNQVVNVGAPVIVVDGTMSAGFPPGCLGKIVGANANVTTDQPFILNPQLESQNYIFTKIVATNASTSLTTVAGGIYPSASKAGTPIVAAAQVYTGLTSAAPYLSLTLATVTSTTVYSAAPILSFTTPQGGAATADFYLFGSELY